jgi:protein SCO1/2
MAASRRIPVLAAALALALCWAAPAARAQVIEKELPKEVRGLGVSERAGQPVPLDAVFTDSTGAKVPLSKYFNQGKPVVLSLVYYDCPFACPMVLQRLQKGLNGVDFTVGEDFNVVVISFDPTNTTEMARIAKATYLAGYARIVTPEVEAGWEFHTSDAATVAKLADAVGFKYRYLDEIGEYAHPVGFTVLTPDGKVSRYFYGYEYPARDLKLALLEASEGKIARTIGDVFLHFCYRLDPNTGKYTLAAVQVMKIGGILTLSGMVLLIAGLKIGEYRRAMRRAGANPAAAPGGEPALGAGVIAGQHP